MSDADDLEDLEADFDAALAAVGLTATADRESVPAVGAT